MPLPIDVLEAELLRLSTVDRTRLLHHLIASLDADHARDQAWARLAAERSADLASGRVQPMSGPETVARLRSGQP